MSSKKDKIIENTIQTLKSMEDVTDKDTVKVLKEQVVNVRKDDKYNLEQVLNFIYKQNIDMKLSLHDLNLKLNLFFIFCLILSVIFGGLRLYFYFNPNHK